MEQLDLTVLRYSRVDEDYRVLSKALQIKPDDVILSITSSGDNVLNLLLERPKKIVTVDVSIAQNSLLELKIVAISHLQSYQDYLILLGEVASDSLNRKRLYDEVKEFLPEYARVYWASHAHLVMNGLSQCGRLQKYLNDTCVIPVSEAVSPAILNEFLDAQDLSKQRKLFDELPLQKIKLIIRNVFTNQVCGRSAVQLKHVALTTDEMVEIMWERFCSVSQNVPNKDNFYYSLFLRGKRSTSSLTPNHLFPPYLREDGFNELKDLVDRIEIHTTSIQSYLSSSTTQFHKMNLSDIFEYMSTEESDLLFTKLFTKTFPGGYLAYWNLFRDCNPPTSDCRATLVELADKLQKSSRMFCFKFRLVSVSL